MTYKVLVVDDSKLARMSVAKMLRSLQPDWSRVEASNAEEAVAALAGEHPDIVLVDFNMPGKDGLTLAAEIHATHPNVPVAVISANIQTEIVTRAGAVGATFLAKPLTEQSLGDFLSSAKAQLGSA
jgi:CheY-like chemotaxis protein